MEFKYSKSKGYILSEVVAAIACIAILTHITSWYTNAKSIQAQAKEGYDFASSVADKVIEYYSENTSYPTSGTYDYGTDPGEYVSSVNYYAPTTSTHGYVISYFRSGPNGLHVVLQDKWIIKKLSVSGSHLVSTCYTNINSSFMSGSVLSDGENSEMVGNSCEVASSVSSVIDI
jgi:hypothetical protein